MRSLAQQSRYCPVFEFLSVRIVPIYAPVNAKPIAATTILTLGASMSDAVSDDVKAWQARSLDALHPILYLDSIHVEVRDRRRRIAAARQALFACSVLQHHAVRRGIPAEAALLGAHVAQAGKRDVGAAD